MSRLRQSGAQVCVVLRFVEIICAREGSKICIHVIYFHKMSHHDMFRGTFLLMVPGYGYENTNNYRGATINFYGIGNIHAVR